MRYSEYSWVKDVPFEIVVCDEDGILVEMNADAVSLFAADGGRGLLGTNVLDCHPEPMRTRLKGMMQEQTSNAYFNTENGEKRFYYQSPWYEDGHYAGFIEISFAVLEEIPNFLRG